MKKAKIISLFVFLALALAACNLSAPATPTPTNNTILTDGSSIVTLAKSAQNSQDIFSNVGQVINYNYSVSNTGTIPLAGPVSILDNKIPTVSCPDLSTIGNNDAYLDPATETLVCTGAYSITQADLDAGSITNVATATLNGVTSNQISLTVPLSTQTKKLSLTKSANPTTYNLAGQVINYTFVIQNTGTATLGPAQFTITDNRIGAINCGENTTTLAPNQSVTCVVPYTITQADLSVASITNSATAGGGGAEPSPAATVTVTNSNPPSSSGLTPGSTISHTVESGEWMFQIARCYGVRYTALRNANLQIANPSFIKPGIVLTVPNIGSAGNIYGKPCIGYYIAQSGDTWNSIAQKYNADYAVLLEANQGVVLGAGRCVRIPLNSAGGVAASQSGLTSCVGVSTPPTTPTPIRLTIPTGTGTITVSNVLSPTGRVRYVLTASQNQIMDITVNAPANEVALAVYDPNGTTLKALDTTLTWSQSLPMNGDYIIELVGVTGINNKNITLQITITNPTS